MAAEKFIIEIRTKGFKGANKSLEQVTKSTRAFSREANKGSGMAATFRRNMSGLRNNLLLVSFAFGTVALGFKKFIDAASGFEDVKTRLVGLMGSTERAERAFRNFNEVAATTPFSLQDVVEAGAQLKAFGADAEGMIKPVTDLAAFMGTTATEAANSLGRAFAGGAGAADILRERGILNLIKSFKGIDDLSKITLPEFRQALQETLIDPSAGIAGSTDRMAQTFTGAFSNMTDSVTRLAANIGNTFMPIIKDMIIGLGDSAKAADHFLTGLKTGKPNFDIFGSSVEKFTARIERLSLEDLNKELEQLKKQASETTKPLEDNAKVTENVTMKIIGLAPVVNAASDGMITISESLEGVDGVQRKNGVTITKLTNFYDGLKNVEKEFNETQEQTTVGVVALNEKIIVLNNEIERRTDNTEELKNAQKAFNELLEKTDLAQLKQIENLELLIATHQDELGTNEEVMAVLTMLKEKYDDLTGATQAAKQEAKDNAKAKKEEEDQLLKTAAATTTIASGLRTMMSAGASAEDQMRALLGTLAKLITMGVFSPGGVATGGSALMGSILGAFVGHTGGLIQDNGIQRFATGGMVQGQDNVPILAQSGEFIMQRSAVNSIGLQNLAQMNQTGEASGALTVNISGNIIGDEEHVRDKVLPAIKEELRREANA